MKKRIISLLLALALALSLAGTALAADDNDRATITDVASGATATFADNGDKIQVTFTSSSLQNGEQYIILMVSGVIDSTNPQVPTISEGTIRYIDQQEVTVDNGAITFTVYPDRLQSSVILISSASTGQQIAAIVDAKYILGDVNGTGDIDILDLMEVCKYSVQLVNPSADQKNAADINGDGYVDILDIMEICKYIVGLVSAL